MRRADEEMLAAKRHFALSVAVEGGTAPVRNRRRGCSRHLWCGEPAGDESVV